MKKFKISGIFTEYVYAESEEEALEKFDEISADYASEPFDEVNCQEMPLCTEKQLKYAYIFTIL